MGKNVIYRLFKGLFKKKKKTIFPSWFSCFSPLPIATFLWAIVALTFFGSENGMAILMNWWFSWQLARTQVFFYVAEKIKDNYQHLPTKTFIEWFDVVIVGKLEPQLN